MIHPRVFLSQARCVSCSKSTLAAFLSCAISPAYPRAVPPCLLKRWITPRRCFAGQSSLRSEATPPIDQAKAVDDEEPQRRKGSSDQETSTETPNEIASPVPWYLQVKVPQQVPSPLSDRQRLHDLPSDPPPLLQPMLEHISIELGLDDLSLLDLRQLDPPPALGANLLMIISTARSEKHLHVSADRFCRWLRTEHKLTPYADGLFGRGELKLKMRRKARRARIMSRVGSLDQGAADDGLRTGWVCVNIGTIEDGSPAIDSTPTFEGYVGFGSQSDGTKLVVQMLTEEKREELDLERLWTQDLMGQEKRKKRIMKGPEELQSPGIGETVFDQTQAFADQGVPQDSYQSSPQSPARVAYCNV